MAGYRCGGCRAPRLSFAGDAGERLARDAGAPLIARLPFDPGDAVARRSRVTWTCVPEALGPAVEALLAALARAGAAAVHEEPRA